MSADLLTARQAAEYVGQSYRGFDQFVRRHALPCEWWGGTRRFSTASLDKLRETFTLRRAQARRQPLKRVV